MTFTVIEARRKALGVNIVQSRPATGVMLVIAMRYADVNQLTSVDAWRSVAMED
jgi:hypothetical protein